MRQNAVSIAPQNEVPIHSAPTAAATPIVVELSRIWASALSRVFVSTAGNRRWRSLSTLASTSGLCRMRPKMNSTRSAKGNSASTRL